jgi:hypothetical protein
MKVERVENNNLEVGNMVYSNYTEQYYIVTFLRFENNITKYALVRLDGCGYFYLSDSINEIVKKMNMDGGETEAYKVLDYKIDVKHDEIV